MPIALTVEDQATRALVSVSDRDWIVQRLVHAHGGEISLDGSPGQRARFTVALPKQPS